MQKFVFSFLVLLSVTSLFGQTEVFSVDTDFGVRLRNISGVPHLISYDSIYKILDDTVEAFPSELVKKELLQVKDSLFINRGGGSVYKLNNEYHLDTLLYAPKMETSFFNSASFVHNDTIVSFGGYGNFKFNKALIFFNESLKSWGYYPDFTLEENKPKPGSIYLPWHYSDDVLTLYRTLEKVDGGPETREVRFLMQQFDFNQKKWLASKDVSDLESLFNSALAVHYGNGYSIFQNDATFSLFDYKQAEVSEFSKTVPLFSNLVSFLIYDDFFYSLNKSANGFKVYRTPTNVFFSQKISSQTVIDQQSSYFLIILVLAFIILALSFIYFRFKPKKVSLILTSKFEDLERDLSNVQFELLKEIIRTHPNPVPFKFILSLYDDSIGYEAKKLKTRKTVKELNDQLEKKFGLKNPLKVRRNPSDKRQYEVFINEK